MRVRGTFTDGPFGIGNGAILTTGQVSGALPVGDGNVDNQGGGSDYSSGGKDAAVIYAGVILGSGYNGLRIEFVFAINEPDSRNSDSIGIFAYTNNFAQCAKFQDSVTGYSKSAPPLVATIPANQDLQVDIYFAVCDMGGSRYDDSTFLVKGYACTDCDLTPNGAEINYVKQTTTLERAEESYTQTIVASGTASGTFIYFVAHEETTTTIAMETNTAHMTTTTAVPEETTTTTSTAGIPRDTTDTGVSTTVNSGKSVGSTTAKVADTTTLAESGTATGPTTADKPTSTIESTSE
ncbi:hypothetical protein FSPOR_1364 [Fusarium sporotrichioides]|uniref:Uncharacterized protein n=1 Tax=Fusarium sporotrichioides TaxID=5514 RepID=A0A395SS58_FUSSP|nr:hypothetical protein FSPOR_1364 [Fusarium sporotrichioides]